MTIVTACGKHCCILPYTMPDGRQSPLFLVNLCLALPVFWFLFGKQFLFMSRSKRPHLLPGCGLVTDESGNRGYSPVRGGRSVWAPVNNGGVRMTSQVAEKS
jgi:hypothetical protein